MGFFGSNGLNGAQAEALRIPYADGTLYPLDVAQDAAVMPSLLTLSDVLGTGHHAAVHAQVAPSKIAAMIGDGAVGLSASMETAVGIGRRGGAIGRVGVPQDKQLPGSQPAFYANLTIGGGPAPARAYIDELLPDVLDGRIEPGRVLDQTVDLDGVPGGYQAMADRTALKVMVRPMIRRGVFPGSTTYWPVDHHATFFHPHKGAR